MGSDGEWEEADSADEDASSSEEDEVAKAMEVAQSVKEAAARPAPGAGDLAAAMAELDMDRYDEESDGEGAAAARLLGAGNPGQAYYANPAADPYLGDKGDSESESGSEADAEELSASDVLIMAARNEDDVSNLEVWVYEEADERGPGNLYVHHSLLLPAFPLSVAWLDLCPGGAARRNLAAVGSFEPGIELWDLDRLDAVEPVATLGGADYEATRLADARRKKKGKKKGKKGRAAPDVEVRPGSHTDAVLGLAWNREFRNVLASASADHCVKVWDVGTGACSATLQHHSSKVQAVAWNPVEHAVLLSGGFDRRAVIADVRAGEGAAGRGWSVPADVEAVTWDPFSPTCFAVASEDGGVCTYDARAGEGAAPLWTLRAHAKAACALDHCPAVAGLVLTASTDKQVKLWNTRGQQPVQLASQDLGVGAVFSASFCRDQPLLVAAGGALGTVAVWDAAVEAAVAELAGVAARQPTAVEE